MKKLRFGIGARGGAAGWRSTVLCVAAFMLALTGCDFLQGIFGGGDSDPPASGAAEETLVFVAAESGATTEALTLVFNTVADGLTADDIPLTALDGGKGETRATGADGIHYGDGGSGGGRWNRRRGTFRRGCHSLSTSAVTAP
ncbi:MAG: hypothetical protein LBG27_12125 [Spirochaetaceae bacterium]|nr:hypothetical protein [Spirochaetaceae bacterium]